MQEDVRLPTTRGSSSFSLFAKDCSGGNHESRSFSIRRPADVFEKGAAPFSLPQQGARGTRFSRAGVTLLAVGAPGRIHARGSMAVFPHSAPAAEEFVRERSLRTERRRRQVIKSRIGNENAGSRRSVVDVRWIENSPHTGARLSPWGLGHRALVPGSWMNGVQSGPGRPGRSGSSRAIRECACPMDEPGPSAKLTRMGASPARLPSRSLHPSSFVSSPKHMAELRNGPVGEGWICGRCAQSRTSAYTERTASRAAKAGSGAVEPSVVFDVNDFRRSRHRSAFGSTCFASRRASFSGLVSSGVAGQRGSVALARVVDCVVQRTWRSAAAPLGSEPRPVKHLIGEGPSAARIAICSTVVRR